MKSFNVFVTALALFVPAVASAEPLPKPVADLDCLVASWKGVGTVSMGADKAKLTATWDCKRTAAKFGVACVLRIVGIPGLPVYEETDLIGYEPNTNTYHWYSVTNAGETHDHVAKVPASDSAQFVFNGVQEGKPFKEVIDFTFSNESKNLKVKAETFVAGASTSVMDVALRK